MWLNVIEASDSKALQAFKLKTFRFFQSSKPSNYEGWRALHNAPKVPLCIELTSVIIIYALTP